jgi:hypothetical protein
VTDDITLGRLGDLLRSGSDRYWTVYRHALAKDKLLKELYWKMPDGVLKDELLDIILLAVEEEEVLGDG